MKHIALLFALFCTIPIGAQCQSAEEPKELLDLRESFEKARSSALSPLEKKYVDALIGLRDRLTKRGDLQGALAVQAELSMMEPTAAVPEAVDGKLRLARFKTIDEFFAWLNTTTWKSADGPTLRFPSKNAVENTRNDGQKATYTMTIEKIGEISWVYTNGRKELMQISPDLKSATRTGAPSLNRIEPR